MSRYRIDICQRAHKCHWPLIHPVGATRASPAVAPARKPDERVRWRPLPFVRRSAMIPRNTNEVTMKHSIVTIGLACVAAVPSQQLSGQAPRSMDSATALAMRVLRTTPLIDGHNDLPWRIREDTVHPMDVNAYDLRQHAPGQTDLPRLKQGMVGGQFWSVYIPGERSDKIYAPNGLVTSDPGYARVQLEQIDIALRMIALYPDRLTLATSAADIRRAFKNGHVASMLGMEGGHAIENSLGSLRVYYDLGVRYMTLTHNVTLDWADAALDTAKHGGLTPFGKEVVREMNRLGMLVDLSHVSPGTMSDALTVTAAPVIFSHSGARGLVNHPRDVPDSILRRVTANGGVVMVPFVSTFVSPAAFSQDSALKQYAVELKQRFPGDSAAQHRALADWQKANPAPEATLGRRSTRAQRCVKLPRARD
jgi:membrane dipeptidase